MVDDPKEIKEDAEQSSMISLCEAPELNIKGPESKNILTKDLASEVVNKALHTKGLSNSEKWTSWVVEAMQEEEFPLTPSKIAAVLAIIEQESSFEVDPKTSGILRKLDENEAEIKKEYPWVETLLSSAGINKLFLRHRTAAGKAKTEGEAVHVLHAAIEDFKTSYPEAAREVAFHNPDWELEALVSIGTLGPTQISVLSTFDGEERQNLTPEAYRLRQLEMVRDPKLAIRHTIRRLKEGALVNGTNFLQTVGDYKGGQDAHFKATVQMALRLVNPNVAIDGDLLRYDLRGLPLDQDSQSLLTAVEFNNHYELGFSKEQIQRAFAKTGKDLTEDCVIRSILEKAGEKEDYDLEVTLDTSKGGNDAKGKETVSQYVKSVAKRYEAWRKQLEDQLRLLQEKAAPPTEEKQALKEDKTVKKAPEEKRPPNPVVEKSTVAAVTTIPDSPPVSAKALRLKAFRTEVETIFKSQCKGQFRLEVNEGSTEIGPYLIIKFIGDTSFSNITVQEHESDEGVFVSQKMKKASSQEIEEVRGDVENMDVIKTKVVSWMKSQCQ